MRKLFFSATFISLFLLSFQLIANDNFIEIKGIVLANKTPIPYIFISIGKTDIKTVSNIDGTFILRVPKNLTFPIKLTFSSVNYTEKTISITKASYKKTQTIKLTPKENYQISYEKQKKSEEKKLEEIRKPRYKKSSKDKAEFAKIETADGVVESEDLGGFSSGIIYEESRVAEEVVVAKSIGSMPRPGSLPPPTEPKAEAGKLTAGELNDFTKWKLWEDIKNTDLQKQQDIWKIYPNERYVAQLTNPNGNAIVNAKVTLKDNQGNNIWQTFTDNTGKAELWAKILTDSLPNAGTPYYILFEYENQTKTIEAHPFYVKINSAEMNVICNEINAVDIDFVVDATGSMDDEIRYLQEELYDVIGKVQINNSHIDLRTGSIFYRDFGDEYITRKSDFDKDINKTIDFIKEQKSDGGGDFPEAIDIALYESIENRNWRENTLSKIIFLILDAPPHSLDSCIKQIQRQIRIAAMKGIRIVPLVCSGSDKSNEYLMRSIALATNGTYVFLTDESGIGESHTKPTTDKYEVEKLNHILLRVVTEFCSIPNCSNNWNYFDSTLTNLDKFIPKPYKENPDDNTERIDISNIFKIYPIPCDGILNVEILKQVPHIYISDITGKVLQNFELENPKSLTINMTDYANGIYFINAYYQGRWYYLKFLLNR